MTPGPVRWLTLACMVSLLGCAGGPAGWRHFHGDLPNSGFLPVRSGYAVSPAWKSPPFAVTGSSPVLGRLADGREAVYVGTADAQLVALDAANGRVLWQTGLRSGSGRSAIVSSPSVAPDGGVIVVVTTEVPGGGLQSTLHKVDRSGVRRWSFPFPDAGVFLGSPRSVGFGQEDLVIAIGTTERATGLRSALLLIRDEGDEARLLDQKDMGDCIGIDAASERAQRTWRALSQPAVGGALPADLRLDPSPAALASGPTLLVAAVDRLCRAGVWEWDGRRLATVWKSTHAGEDHSSPAMLANRLVAFGRGDGRLVGYDVRTGVKMWEYDAGEPVVSTPSESSEGLLYVASLQHLHAVNAATGSVGPAGPQRLRFQGPTLASPAVTADCVYLPAREMLTVSHNFKVRSHNTDFVGNGLSSPAVGANGSVYVVAADGAVWKYKGH
jgi:outer membrane protein assembly factor BamB